MEALLKKYLSFKVPIVITQTTVKAIGRFKPCFLLVVYFEFLLSFKLLFTALKNLNYFLRYDWSKLGCITGF